MISPIVNSATWNYLLSQKREPFMFADPNEIMKSYNTAWNWILNITPKIKPEVKHSNKPIINYPAEDIEYKEYKET